MDRALPGSMVDLITDGVPTADLRRDGARAVWSALVRTAASAKQRGWDQWEWVALVERRTSKLGTQAMIKRGRTINRPAFLKRLDAAWAAAEKWLDSRPAAWSRDDLLDEIAAVRTWMQKVTTMTDDETAVMNHAIDKAEEWTTMRPALPWRQVSEATGLNPRRTREALASLVESGALILDARGYAGRTKRRANLYLLPRAESRDVYLSRVPRHMDQPARDMDQPAEAAVDHGAGIWTKSDHITISGTPQALAQLLELARSHGVPVNQDDAGQDADVIPLRRNA